MAEKFDAGKLDPPGVGRGTSHGEGSKYSIYSRFSSVPSTILHTFLIPIHKTTGGHSDILECTRALGRQARGPDNRKGVRYRHLCKAARPLIPLT
jgi:hypothetical protein